MSRIGKKAIAVPDGVTVTSKDSQLTVKGAKGQQEVNIPEGIKVAVGDKEVKVEPQEQKVNSQIRMLWGTTRSHIANAIMGVSEGFVKKLEINGVGYRASIQGQKMELSLGYSHPIEFIVPEGVEAKVNKNIIELSGIDSQLVGQVAADIRDFRKPEPYKGKGIKYAEEHIRRKEMKKALADGEGDSGS